MKAEKHFCKHHNNVRRSVVEALDHLASIGDAHPEEFMITLYHLAHEGHPFAGGLAGGILRYAEANRSKWRREGLLPNHDQTRKRKTSKAKAA